jgi:hypothetical protein
LVAEFAELADHSGGACLPRLFGNRWTVFLVTDSLVQDQPDQPALSMGHGPNDLVMSQAWDGAPINYFEDTSFDLHGGIGGLIE